MQLSLILTAVFLMGHWCGKTTNERNRQRALRRRWEQEQAKLPRAVRRTPPKKRTKAQRLGLDEYERSTA